MFSVAQFVSRTCTYQVTLALALPMKTHIIALPALPSKHSQELGLLANVKHGQVREGGNEEGGNPDGFL